MADVKTDKTDGLYGLLAERAKTKDARRIGGNDGEFFAPDTKGQFVINKLILKKGKLGKKTVILVGQILEAHATEAGARVQLPGCAVKQLYMLTKYEWAIDSLMNDLLNIIGVDEKSMSPEDLEELFTSAFEGEKNEKGDRPGVSAFRGCAANFRGYTVTERGEGKKDLDKVEFSEAKGEINSPEKIKERAKSFES
jgi:hypothetical protein